MPSFKYSFNIVPDEQALFEFRRRDAVCISSHIIGSSTSQKVLSFLLELSKLNKKSSTSALSKGASALLRERKYR